MEIGVKSRCYVFIFSLKGSDKEGKELPRVRPKQRLWAARNATEETQSEVRAP